MEEDDRQAWERQPPFCLRFPCFTDQSISHPRDAMEEKNKQTVMEYVDAFNRGDIDGLCALFAPDARIYGVLGWGSPEKLKPVWQASMSSLRTKLNIDSIIAEGDIVAVRYTEHGRPAQTCNQAARGPASDDAIYEAVAMEWFEVKNGVIHRRWCARDTASVFRQARMSN